MYVSFLLFVFMCVPIESHTYKEALATVYLLFIHREVFHNARDYSTTQCFSHIWVLWFTVLFVLIYWGRERNVVEVLQLLALCEMQYCIPSPVAAAQSCLPPVVYQLSL